MQYVGISTKQFIPYYASIIHKHTHTHIFIPFEDSEPTGLKVDIAISQSVLECVDHNLYVPVDMCVCLCVCVCVWACIRFPVKWTLGKAVSQALSTGMESKTDSLCSSSLDLWSCLSKIDAGCECCCTVHVQKSVLVMA